ncbi:MAG: UTP--glucose-1-phosphate uridylyltransferase [Chloroflexi bacterium]|nr:MAG: UTP--glucose-1-phosphate uridylyltransferase [Chloroflexota bacterium]
MRSLACSSAPSIWAPDPPNLSPRPPLVSTRTVRKAIFPAAGLGTRFLPVTKAQPKEMLPLVDKPTIQYGVEEAIASGIEQVIMVTGGGKRAIVDHFDRSLELEHYLEERGRSDLLHILAEVDALSNELVITYIQQKEPRGLGHAVWTARLLVEGEACAVLLKQLIDAHRKTGATVLAVRRVPKNEVSRYGIIATAGAKNGIYEVTDVVEKPSLEDAPSDLAALGRYVILPAVFDELEKGQPGAGKEIQLVDAIKRTIGSQPVVGIEFEGDYYDTGTVPGYLRANLTLAMKREGLREELVPLLQELLEASAEGSAPRGL